MSNELLVREKTGRDGDKYHSIQFHWFSDHEQRKTNDVLHAQTTICTAVRYR